MREFDTLLWFAPEAALVDPYSLEMALATSCSSFTKKVFVLGCSRDLQPLCPAMMARGLNLLSNSRAKDEVCRLCTTVLGRVRGSSELDFCELSAFSRPDDSLLAQELCDSVTKNDYLSLIFEGVPVGRYSTYLPLLRFKATTVCDSTEIWHEYLSELHSVVRIVLASQRAFGEICPDLAITSNHLYGTHRAFLAVARARGIESWGVAPGGLLPNRTTTALFLPAEKSSQTLALSGTIGESRTQPITDVELDLLSRHFRVLIGASDPWVYSTEASQLRPEQVRGRLGLRPSSKVVTILLSSPDETRAAVAADADYRIGDRAGHLGFSDFLERVFDCAAQSPDIDFVARIHPRMGANKRESMVSPDLLSTLELLGSRPGNVHIDEPTLGNSLYDDILISSAALNFTSSSGLEFMACGIPVIHMDGLRLGAYPCNIGIDASHVSSLSHLLVTTLEEGWFGDLPLQVFRWWASILVRIAVFPFGVEESLIEESLPLSEAGASSAVKGQLLRNLIPARGKHLGARMLARRQSSQFQLRPPNFSSSVEIQVALESHGMGEVWNPSLIMRGSPLKHENDAVLKVVRTSLDTLMWNRWSSSNAEGMGVVESLFKRGVQ